jgi:ribosomal protein S18 acetylase RimI-like enzyme
MPSEAVSVTEAASPEDIGDVRLLFGEYATSLGWDLTAGWIADELAGLPGPYAPPAGSLLLARVGDSAAGAVGLQLVPETSRCGDVDVSRSGELKRLYVRPEFRRHGVALALMRRAEQEGQARGYDSLLLTTSAQMFPLAQGLYDSLGYVETIPYRNDMPYPGIRWMRKPL